MIMGCVNYSSFSLILQHWQAIHKKHAVVQVLVAGYCLGTHNKEKESNKVPMKYLN